MSLMRNLRGLLIPQVNTDKNGNSQIRWVKPDMDIVASKVGNMPPPVKGPVRKYSSPPVDDSITPGPVLDMNTRMKLFTQYGGPRDDANLKQLLDSESPENIGILDEALQFRANSDDSPAAVHEKKLIDSMVNMYGRSSDRDPEGTMFKGLALRKAFCSEWAQQQSIESIKHHMRPFVNGVMNRFPDTKEGVDKIVAELRFAFELKMQRPKSGFLPTETVQYSYDRYEPDKKVDAEMNCNGAMQEFVRENPERVDDIIKLVLEREVMVPEMLRVWLEDPDITGSLTDGFL